jgi:hypothetical protein
MKFQDHKNVEKIKNAKRLFILYSRNKKRLISEKFYLWSIKMYINFVMCRLNTNNISKLNNNNYDSDITSIIENPNSNAYQFYQSLKKPTQEKKSRQSKSKEKYEKQEREKEREKERPSHNKSSSVNYSNYNAIYNE